MGRQGLVVGAIVALLLAVGCATTDDLGAPLACCDIPSLGPKTRTMEVYSVTGVVRDTGPFDGPVSGATVTAVWGPSSFGPVVSDLDGRFYLEVPKLDRKPARIEITVAAGGFEPSKVVLTPRARDMSLEIAMRPER